MKLYPKCSKECLNSANACACGYSFLDEPTSAANANATRRDFGAKTIYFVIGLVLFLVVNLLTGFAAQFGSRIGYFVGFAVGLIPLGVATKKHEVLGMVGCFCCCVAGAIAGLIGAVPTAAAFWLIINEVKKKSG
jgi:hypothetical protein